MKSVHFLALALLISGYNLSADIAVAVAQAQADSQIQQTQPPAQPTLKTPATPLTDGLASLGIKLNNGYNHPCPGVTISVYPKANDHVTIETEITFEDNESTHPIIAQIMYLVGYEPEQRGWFYNSEPKATKKDVATTVVSIKKPYIYSSSHEVHIKLRTLLNDEQLMRYSALLKAKLNAKKEPVSFKNEDLLNSIIISPTALAKIAWPINNKV